MAKNVKLSWTNPATVSDIDTIDVYRKAGDHTAVTDMDAFRSGATLAASVAVGAANASQEVVENDVPADTYTYGCLLYTSPSPRDRTRSRMPSSA